jgi:hypothetical protein
MGMEKRMDMRLGGQSPSLRRLKVARSEENYLRMGLRVPFLQKTLQSLYAHTFKAKFFQSPSGLPIICIV